MSIILQENKKHTPFPTLGDCLRHYRQKANLSQLQLAKSMGCCQATIAHYESGRVAPPLRVLQKIAIELNISLNVLVAHKLKLTD